MGWSIKKPFGGKKSVFNQVARVTGVGTVAATTAQTLSLKTVASSINKNSGLLTEKQLDRVGGQAQIVGASLAGGALLNSIAGAPAAVTRTNVITGQDYLYTPPRSFLSGAWQGLTKVASTGLNLAEKGAGALGILKAGGGSDQPKPQQENPTPDQPQPQQENPTSDLLSWLSKLPGHTDLAKNLPASPETSQNADAGGGPASYETASMGGKALLPLALLGIIGFVLIKKGGRPPSL